MLNSSIFYRIFFQSRALSFWVCFFGHHDFRIDKFKPTNEIFFIDSKFLEFHKHPILLERWHEMFSVERKFTNRYARFDLMSDVFFFLVIFGAVFLVVKVLRYLSSVDKLFESLMYSLERIITLPNGLIHLMEVNSCL